MISSISNKIPLQRPPAEKNNFSQNQPAKKQQKNTKFLKPAVFLSSLGGVLLVVSSLAKKQKINIFKDNKLSDIFKPHKWKLRNKNIEGEDIIKIASGSIMGGLGAGLLLDKDKDNRKAKLREGFQQILGNIIIPVFTVDKALKIFGDKIKTPQIKHLPKLTKFLSSIPKVGITAIALGAGMIAGNFIANKLSYMIFKTDQKRKIKASDFSGHMDDICLAAVLISPGSKIGQIAGNLVPAALLISGYETGIKKN